MVRPHAGDRGKNGRPARPRPLSRPSQQRSANRLPYPDERPRPPYPAQEDDPRVPPAPRPANVLQDGTQAQEAHPEQEGDERRAPRPPLDVVLEMTRGEGPIAGSARALGIALLASAGLVLVGLVVLVVWAVRALF